MEQAPIVLEGHTRKVYAVVYSPDGLLAVSAGEDGMTILRESESDQVVLTLKQWSGVWSMAFSVDSKRLLSGSEDNTARVWDVAGGECLSELKHPRDVLSVAWSPDDTFFLTGCKDGCVRMWDAATYECLHILDGHTDWVLSLAFSPDSTFFVSSGLSTFAVMWELRPGDAPCEVRRLEGHTFWVCEVAVSPDGSRIATASWDHSVKMWSVEGNELWSTDVGALAFSIAFSPNGTFLAVGVGSVHKAVGPHGEKWIPPSPIVILDGNAGEEVLRLVGHCGKVRAVAYHPLGHTLLSGSYDFTCRKWELPAALIDPPAL